MTCFESNSAALKHTIIIYKINIIYPLKPPFLETRLLLLSAYDEFKIMPKIAFVIVLSLIISY